MFNTINRYKAKQQNNKITKLFYILWRRDPLINMIGRHCNGFILNRYFSRYTLNNFVFINNSNKDQKVAKIFVYPAGTVVRFQMYI